MPRHTLVQVVAHASAEPALALDVGSPPDALVWADTPPPREFMSVGTARTAVALAAAAARAASLAFAASDSRLAGLVAGIPAAAELQVAAAAAAPAPALAGGFRRARVAAAARRALAAHTVAAAALAASGAAAADHATALRAFIADLRAGARAALTSPEPASAPARATPAEVAAELAARLRAAASAAADGIEAIGQGDRGGGAAVRDGIRDVHSAVIEIEALFDTLSDYNELIL